MKIIVVTAFLVLNSAGPLAADGPGDNDPSNVRRVPRLGIELSEADRDALTAGLQALKSDFDDLRRVKDPATRELLPDVEIFYRAVHDALEYREFFAEGDIAKAKNLLAAGRERAAQLKQGKAPWTKATGLVVRGFRSRIDGSVQPYGLVIPDSYRHEGNARHRCDLWFHGRGETVGELRFLDQRMNRVGRYAPAETIVLHPYGRYSNAFKFAGEVDVLEALAHAQRHYRIDEDRISVRGFSMGGAGCWQFAVHYADRFFAANPGAGFSETPKFLEFFQKETLRPTWYQKKLWHLYDCDDVAVNLMNTATIAYSGELDIQKQAADVMEAAAAREGIDLVHVIGPQTKHTIHKDSMADIERRMASLARRGRIRVPREVSFATYTLKYNAMHWVTIDALGEHWEQARVDARLSTGQSKLAARTRNVTAITLSMPPGWCPFAMTRGVTVNIDGQSLEAPRPKSDRSWRVSLVRDGERWRLGTLPGDKLRKQHDLQGPIDDAFMDAFLVVAPTGTSPNKRFEEWSRGELGHFREHWRRQFRGYLPVKDDTAVTEADIAEKNLILFGDARSNTILARVAEDLPFQWSGERIVAGEKSFDAADHALIAIYPNPLNPKRYVVLNSGFTYREYAYLNNARQVPMLPDWAVVDLNTPPGSQHPGKIVAADFFTEDWQLREGR